MKKLIVLLLILTVSRASVTFGNPNSGLSIRDYFLGNSAIANENVNQVLALLVGPEGPPGPAGVAGRNGFNGINGLDGLPGIPGAPGPVGPRGPQGERGEIGPQGPIGLQGIAGPAGSQGPAGATGAAGQTGATGAQGPAGPAGLAGTSVLIQQVAVGDSTQCSGRGGTKFISGLTISYACNGATSSSTGGSSSVGQGQLDIGSCDSDGQVTFEIATYFRGDDFVLDGVKIFGVDADCLGSKLFLYFKIKETGTIFLPSALYSLGDLATCGLDLDPSISTGSGDAHIFNMPAGTDCLRESANRVPGDPIAMSLIGTRDLNGLIGFEIVGQ